MSKLEERENRRKSIVGSMIHTNTKHSADSAPEKRSGREAKKRVSLVLPPSLYEDIQHIAYVQRRSTSQLVADVLEQYRYTHKDDLETYEEISK